MPVYYLYVFFDFFSWFRIGLFVLFLFFSYWVVKILYIFGIHLFYQIYALQISILAFRLWLFLKFLLKYLTELWEEKNIFIFMESNLTLFIFYGSSFASCLRNCYLAQGFKILFPIFFFRNFIVLTLYFSQWNLVNFCVWCEVRFKVYHFFLSW